MLPTKESACFFTFLLLSCIFPPLDLHPTSAWNISACWVRLQAEKRCSLNKAIPCPLTGTCRYASSDYLFLFSLRYNEYACSWVCSTWEEGDVCTSVCVCVCVCVCVSNHVCTEANVYISGDLCCWSWMSVKLFALVSCFIVLVSALKQTLLCLVTNWVFI